LTAVTRRLREALRPNPAWIALAAALGLCAMGIGAIAISSHPDQAADQSRWLLISFGVLLATMLPHPRTISLLTWPLLALIVALLVVLIVPGVPSTLVHPRNGAKCWINFYFMDFQPSEIAKILFVLALARYMRYRENYRTLVGLLVPFVIMFVPIMLILGQPDMGTALLFLPALFVVLIAAGARMAHIWTLIGLAVLFVVLNVVIVMTFPDELQILKPHQRDRIVSMISLARNEDQYTLSTAFQQDTAKNLVGAGGVTGYGQADAGTLVRLNKLPEDHNDMVFAIIVNRWGLLGGMAVLGCYLLLILSFLIVASRSKDPFVRLSVVGFAGLIGAQAAVNIAMNIGLAPIIGITLPFVSYGGSSLLASFMMLGLVMNFASRRPQMLARPSFEFDNADAVFQ
jgi:cell division protein FtsW (lipid II flippase)